MQRRNPPPDRLEGLGEGCEEPHRLVELVQPKIAKPGGLPLVPREGVVKLGLGDRQKGYPHARLYLAMTVS